MFAVMNLAGYTAPEADDLRKAISKKQKDKLLKHREKFIKGSTEGGIQEETAREIFDAWEEFARYGFNKAHAADYGVLAVQTAYLKAHYPVEYMTALLSVSQNDTSKVALYAADSRRMGIEVAPPDVNISEWDFSIEDKADQKSAIRFGLGAVKNVGHAPVDVILEARDAEGSFEDINDFAHRVDLRHVGKRALECLVRVGALDAFGSRPAMLQSLDRLISFSAAHFKAAEMGQISFFNADTGLQEEFNLPALSTEVSHREQLNWERELIGLYVSDHPLNPVIDVLNDIVTHFSGQLTEANPEDRVRLAGMVTRFRTHQTRKGQSMAFATLEDLQGEVELVIFPRAWQQISNQFEVDKLIVAEGRIDPESSEPKLLVDTIKTDLKITSVAKPDPVPRPVESPKQQTTVQPKSMGPAEAESTAPQAEPGVEAVEVKEYQAPYESTPEREQPGDETAADVGWAAEEQDNLPPQPDVFPEDWDMARTVMEVVADPEGAIETAEAASEDVPEPPAAFDAPEVPPTGQGQPIEKSTPAGPEISTPLPPYIVSPQTSSDPDAVQMVTIVLRSSQDKVRDNLRIRQIYGTLIAFPGNDRFALHVFERGHGYLIEFPNFTTKVCPELISRLNKFIPADQLRVEPITFQ